MSPFGFDDRASPNAKIGYPPLDSEEDLHALSYIGGHDLPFNQYAPLYPEESTWPSTFFGLFPALPDALNIAPQIFPLPLDPFPIPEDRDADGEPDPEYEPSTSYTIPRPHRGTPYHAEPCLPSGWNSKAGPSPSRFQISTFTFHPTGSAPADFPDLPPIPHDLYLYAVKRDAASKKMVGIEKNQRWTCSLCCVPQSPEAKVEFPRARSTRVASTNDAWRHLHHVHLKNDVRAYSNRKETIDIISLLYFSILRACYETEHDSGWSDISPEEREEIDSFYSVYGRCKADGPTIKTIEEGKRLYPWLMARLASFIPSWLRHFACPNCGSTIGRDWNGEGNRHPPVHCDGKKMPLLAPTFVPWPMHPEVRGAPTLKRHRASLDDNYGQPSKKRRKGGLNL